MAIIDETDRMYEIELEVDSDGDLVVIPSFGEDFYMDRDQAVQLVEVLQRYIRTGQVDV